MGKPHHRMQDQIVTLYNQGLSAINIRKKFESQGLTVTSAQIYYTLNNFKSGNLSAVRDAHERRKTKLSALNTDYVHKLIDKTNTLSSTDVQQELSTLGCYLSKSSVKRVIKKAGFKSAKPRYGQMVRDVNKIKRVDFCKQLIESNDNFDDVIFTDESTIQLHQNKKVVYIKDNEMQTVFPKPKHPLKLHVWAGISRKGPTKITIFDGIMESTFYTSKILGENLVPFIKMKFPNGHRFQQDNDPKHRSKLAKDFMLDNNINWTPWPAESPDINPIEMVWNQMKRFVAKEEPKTKQELQEAIGRFWSQCMTKEQCNAYIDHLYKVVPVCVKMGGAATGDIPKKLFPESSRGKSIRYFVEKLDMDKEN